MSDLTAEMIVDSLLASGVRVSPDGSRVAFVVAPIGQREEHPTSAIWLSRADGATAAVRLTAGTVADQDPHWSPAGDALYFLSDRVKRGVCQLYRIPVAGGEATALTDWEPGIADAVPLANGTLVAILAVDADTPEAKKRKEERDDAEVFGERWPLHRLRLFDLEGREMTTIDALGDLHVDEVAPSPDGAQIAVVAWPTPELDNGYRRAEIWIVDVDTRAARRCCAMPTGGSNLVWGDDGQLVYIAGKIPDGGGGNVVFAVAAGGEPRQVTPEMDACPMELAVSRKGTVLVLAAAGLDSWIGRLDAKAGALEPLTRLDGDAHDLSVSADGATVALVRSTRDDLANVWAGPAAGEPRQISDLNPGLREVRWGDQEPLAWQAPDGLAIDGVLILPPGQTRGGGPFPLMTLVHGGPYGRSANALHLSWSRWGQWLATAGYAVLLPNPRGGAGHGHAFADRVAGAVGIGDWSDVKAGIDLLIAQGVADPDRLGIGGWSQGGFMTAWAVGQTDDFKAGIMGAGVSDWGMMAATSDLPHFEMMLGGSTGWEGVGPHRHDALSPISFVGGVTTPVLVLHGENDARVPVSQGRYFAQALRQCGTPCELVVYPREPHSIRERNHQLDLLRRVRGWVERWLGAV